MKPVIGTFVHYYTSRTMKRQQSENGTAVKARLDVPERIGPFAALITHVKEDGSLELKVFQTNTNDYPAFDVTEVPSKAVQHYWASLPKQPFDLSEFEDV